MSNRRYVSAALLSTLALLPVAPALAQGEILITHAKALAGNVTPGDLAGYPVRIGASGSYVLGSNLTPPVGQTAVQIFASNVTIDLAGYTITGNARSAWYGIVGAGGRNGATIKNGTIEGFEFDGMVGNGNYWIVESMRIVGNGRDGVVNPAGEGFRIVTSTVSGNGGFGIRCQSACHIEGNVVHQNGSVGIVASFATVLGNTIIANQGVGISLVGGYGNNTLMANNAFGAQVSGASFAMHPNACDPACP